MLTVALCWAAPATAQIEPTAEEIEANEQALAAASAEDLDRAIEILEQLVQSNGANLYWLNLGRAYQRANMCDDAIRAYSKSLNAPAVAEPSRAEVRETATRYLNQLIQQCPGTVAVACDPPALTVTVRPQAGGEERPVMCGDVVELVGGAWIFTGRLGDTTTTKDVHVRAAQATDVQLVVQPSAEISPPPDVEAARPSNGAVLDAMAARRAEDQRRGTRGFVFLGIGIGTLTTAIALDGVVPGFPATARNGELDAMDFVPATLYLASLPFLIVGIMNLAGR